MKKELLLRIPTEVVKPSAVSAVSQEALKAFSELPQTIRLILDPAAPEISEKLANNLRLLIGLCSVPNTPETSFLTASWQVLDEALSVKSNSSPADFKRQLNALVISDLLSVQFSDHPAKQKEFFRRMTAASESVYAQIKTAAQAEPDDKTSYVRVSEKAREFQTTVEDILKKVPKKEKDMLAKLRLLSACIENANGSLFRFCEPYLSRDFALWLASLSAIIGKNGEVFISPFTESLLFSEKLNEMCPSLHYLAWRDSFITKIRENRQQTGESKLYEEKEHIQYFLAHSDIWQPFWQTKTEGNSPRMDEFVRQDSADHNLSETVNKFKVNMDMPILSLFFLQDEEIARKFLDTAKVVDVPQEKVSLYRKLLGAVGVIKNLRLENANAYFPVNMLKEFLEQEKQSTTFQEELAILNDEVAGIIYLDSNLLVWARGAKNTISKEEFLQAQARLGRDVLYASNAPWPEPKTETVRKIPEPEKPRNNIGDKPVPKLLERGEIAQLWPWGKVQSLPANDSATVIDCLNEKISGFGLNEDLLLNLLSNYNSHATLTNKDTILPDLLPKNHSLAKLKDLGVIGIEHLDGNLVRFVIAADKTGVKTKGPQKLILEGQLNANNELEIPNTPEEFPYSPLHLFLNAAALLAKTYFVAYASALTKEEERKTHSLQQVWKDLAKINGLPLLVSPGSNANGAANLVRILIMGEGTKEKLIRLAFAEK